jgi:hypothetical protein
MRASSARSAGLALKEIPAMPPMGVGFLDKS